MLFCYSYIPRDLLFVTTGKSYPVSIFIFQFYSVYLLTSLDLKILFRIHCPNAVCARPLLCIRLLIYQSIWCLKKIFYTKVSFIHIQITIFSYIRLEYVFKIFNQCMISRNVVPCETKMRKQIRLHVNKIRQPRNECIYRFPVKTMV